MFQNMKDKDRTRRPQNRDLGDKTMEDKLMCIPKDNTQKSCFMLKCLDTSRLNQPIKM